MDLAPAFPVALVTDQGLGSALVPAKKSFGVVLKSLMDARDVTSEDVSRATGIHSSTMSRLRKARRGPSTDVLLKLAKYFGVSADEMFDEDRGLARVGLARVRRPTDTAEGAPAHRIVVPPSSMADSGLPPGHQEVGPMQDRPDAELFGLIEAYWRVLSHESRVALVDDAHRRKLDAITPAAKRRS